MGNQNPQFQQSNIPQDPKKNWFSKHMLLGILFLLAVFAAAVAGIYYWQTVKQIPAKVDLPVHKDVTANWQTYTNSQYRFEIKIPKDWIVTENSSGLYFVSPDMQAGQKENEANCAAKRPCNVELPYYSFAFENNFDPSSAGNTQHQTFNSIDFMGYDQLDTMTNGFGYETEHNGKIYNFSILFKDDTQKLEELKQTLSTFKFTEPLRKSTDTASPPDLNEDLLPLYTKYSWGEPINSSYSFAKSGVTYSYSIVAVAAWGTGQVPQDFINYYYDKLHTAGWKNDPLFDAYNTYGRVWGFVKNSKHIILSYQADQIPGKDNRFEIYVMSEK